VDLMSHHTGMPRHDFSFKWSDDVPGIVSLRRFSTVIHLSTFPYFHIKKMKILKPSAELRGVWQYDNMMYTVLSYLPTLVLPSKTPFTRYLKEHIFDPLAMSSTTYSYEVANASGQLADGMTKQGNFSRNIFANRTVSALPFGINAAARMEIVS
jgi:CubicO group peptidase (beta-lactamase class C family)